MRVILDTNVLVSGVMGSGAPSDVVAAWYESRYEIAATHEIIAEYRRIATRLMSRFGDTGFDRLIDLIENVAALVEPARHLDLHCDDPDDIKFLEAAVGARAKYLVTGDKALLRVRRFPYGRVVTVREFLAQPA